MPPNPSDGDGTTGEPGVTIELADATDVDRVVDHWIDLASQQRDHGSRVLPEANRETIRQVLGAHQIGDGLLVARDQQDICGFASFSIERGTFELDATRATLSNLYVAPGARDAGVGSALLNRVETLVADRGADVLVLEAMAANEAARRFYRRHGYEPTRVSMERPLDEVAENDTHSKDDG